MLIKLLKFSLQIILVFTFYSCSNSDSKQVDTKDMKYKPLDQALYDTIFQKDSLLFEAFNSRNFVVFKSFFSNDLEIYQDNTGLRDYDQSMEAFNSLFNMNYILTRKLIQESLEVYPIKDYGAIEVGRHSFCHMENGSPDCGVYKFVHIWKLEKGQWLITKIITYDHK